MERRWKNKDNENVQKIQWHPAFVAATKIEFEDEREKLKFESEYQLSKKPMQIDLLILKKVENVSIYKNIGKIFREIMSWNIKARQIIWELMTFIRYMDMHVFTKQILRKQIV